MIIFISEIFLFLICEIIKSLANLLQLQLFLHYASDIRVHMRCKNKVFIPVLNGDTSFGCIPLAKHCTTWVRLTDRSHHLSDPANTLIEAYRGLVHVPLMFYTPVARPLVDFKMATTRFPRVEKWKVKDEGRSLNRLALPQSRYRRDKAFWKTRTRTALVV